MRTCSFPWATCSAALTMTLGWTLTIAGCTDGTGAAAGSDASASLQDVSNDVAADQREESSLDAGADFDAPALDADAAMFCSQFCEQSQATECATGTICVSGPGSQGGTCVPVPADCAGSPTCDCLGAALCQGGSSYACYSASDLASTSPSCLSGVACTNASCGHPAGGATCGDAQCGSGSVCVSQSRGGMPEAGIPPVCQPVPAACANHATCECLGATLCVANGEGYRCADDDAGCSQSVLCTTP
jgi:hypothetical protein